MNILLLLITYLTKHIHTIHSGLHTNYIAGKNIHSQADLWVSFGSETHTIMKWNLYISSTVLLFSFSILAAVSTSTSLSDGIFINQPSTGRNLLQAKKPCPLSFEFQNYTVITSQCKGPQYPAKQCCDALVQFACPFSDYLNDLSNDCASTMFSYINLHGKYPPGLFASECKGDKQGLACTGLGPSQSANSNNSQMSCRLSPMLMIATAFMGLLLLLL